MNYKLKTMKNTILYLLVISFLLQSCYTYKATSILETPLIVGKNYKIREADKFVKSKIITANDSVITVMEGNVKKDIYVAKIKEIKAREFSTLKTVGLTVGLTLGILVAAGAAVAASGGFL